jgi:hypothetical protein
MNDGEYDRSTINDLASTNSKIAGDKKIPSKKNFVTHVQCLVVVKTDKLSLIKIFVLIIKPVD